MSPQDEFQSLQEQLRRSQPEAPQAPPAFKRELRRQLLEKHDMRSYTTVHLTRRLAFAAAILVALPLLYLVWSRGGLGLPPPEPEFTAGGPGPAAVSPAATLEPAPGPDEGAPVWIESIGTAVPLDPEQSEVEIAVGYDLGSYAGGYVTLSFQVERPDEGSSGGISAYVAAGESPLRLPVQLDSGWFDENGALSADVRLSLALDGMVEGGGLLPIFPPADRPDPDIAAELSIDTVSGGSSANGEPALLIAISYQRQLAVPAPLRVTVDGGEAGLLASREITVARRAELLELALPLALEQLPADLILTVNVLLDEAQAPLSSQLSVRAGSLVERGEARLWLEGYWLQMDGGPEARPLLALTLGYRLDQRFDHGTLTFDYQHQTISGGGGGGGEQMLTVGQGVHQMHITLAGPAEAAAAAGWPAGLTVDLALKGVGPDGSQEPLAVLTLPCPALADTAGLCQE